MLSHNGIGTMIIQIYKLDGNKNFNMDSLDYRFPVEGSTIAACVERAINLEIISYLEPIKILTFGKLAKFNPLAIHVNKACHFLDNPLFNEEN